MSAGRKLYHGRQAKTCTDTDQLRLTLLAHSSSPAFRSAKAEDLLPMLQTLTLPVRSSHAGRPAGPFLALSSDELREGCSHSSHVKASGYCVCAAPGESLGHFRASKCTCSVPLGPPTEKGDTEPDLPAKCSVRSLYRRSTLPQVSDRETSDGACSRRDGVPDVRRDSSAHRSLVMAHLPGSLRLVTSRCSASTPYQQSHVDSQTPRSTRSWCCNFAGSRSPKQKVPSRSEQPWVHGPALHTAANKP